MSRFSLGLILIIAGCLHLLRPELFDSAIPFEPKRIINLVAGFLELALAVGLWSKKFQDLAARLAALWFLLLIPIHVYVSWNRIEMFGISHPALLWTRTLLQPILYFWALTLQTRGWIMAQTWRDVMFLHYEVDPMLLQKKVPFKLDLYQGKAIISIVSFCMDSIRFPFLPPVPGLKKLNELNLRTYVEVGGVRGVYFFTLDADLKPAIWIAKTFFHLPYRQAKISLQKHLNQYKCRSENAKTSLHFVGEIGQVRKSTEFDLWAIERYGLFTRSTLDSFHGVVGHIPWELKEVTLNVVQDNFSSQLGDHLKANAYLSPSYSSELKVRFRPFYKLLISQYLFK